MVGALALTLLSFVLRIDLTESKRIIGADGEVLMYKRPGHVHSRPRIRMLNSPLNLKDFDVERQLLVTGRAPIFNKAVPDVPDVPDIPGFGGGGGKVIDGINYMRAEICAKMIGKHEERYKAFQKCEEFMRDICRPGRDEMMSGGKRERSTGEGWCEAFFPALEEKTTTTTTTEKKHESKYDETAGKILGKPLEGHTEKLDPQDAEALCEELGDTCAGFTCDKHGKKCTVRAPGTLKDSPHGEVSFVKPDFDPAEHEEKEEEEPEAEEASKSSWDRQEGQTLGEPIEGHTKERGVKASEEACEKLGDKCAGFTCDKDEKVCTLRGPGDLVSSDNGEVSYLKPASKEEGKASSGSGGVIAHMDEGQAVAEQGFTGHPVAHDDQNTFTGDWLTEFGPKSRGEKNIHEICKDHPENGWCKRHGYHQSNAWGLRGTGSLAFFLAALSLMA